MMNKRMRMAIPAALASMAMLLAGCGAGGGSTADETSSGDVTLKLSWWGGDSLVRITEEVVKGFEAEHPNIHVEMEYADWSSYWDKLATQIAGGNMPDVYQMDSSYLNSYAANGSLYDLSKTDRIATDDIDSTLIDMGKSNGTLYAIPTGTTPFGVAVNMDLVEKYGVEMPDTDTWTWDDFEAFEKELLDKSDGEVHGATMMNNKYCLELWARQHGDILFKDGKLAIKPATLSSFFQRTVDQINMGIVGNADSWAENNSSNIETSEFGTGKSAVLFINANMLPMYTKTIGTDNVKLFMLPSDSQGKWAYMKPCMYWSMGSKTEHPAEAAMLIDYLVNSEVSGDANGIERGVPANNTVFKKQSANATGPSKTLLDFTEAYKAKVGESPEMMPAGASDLDKVISRYQQNVVFGKITADQAAEQLIAEVQAAIDEAAV
ncbi:ABC transporter substrate-binding protein [Bifidobacterium avesanii]|nr:sugar ABC transporter substrate-binding protein [Bifidobacterium avesanii]KAB8295579.1 Bacterial extracellular solute-binding protein [Bifidobacterium avesanii]